MTIVKTGGVATEVWAALTGVSGTLLGILGTIYAYRFASTQQSATKNALIGGALRAVRDPMQRWEGGLHVCAGLLTVSQPFDAGSTVELRFELSPCHGLTGGELRLRVPAEDAKDYAEGDEFSIRIRQL